MSLARSAIARAVPAALLLLLLLSSAAFAGSYQVAPTLAEAAPGSSVASFKVRNTGSEPLSVQVETLAWSQENGTDHYQPATDLVVVPRIATIQPGKTQLVRVALRNLERTRERAYRVHFVELPPPPQPGFIGVRTLLRFNVPLFFAADGPPAQIDWRASLVTNGELVLSARNSGSHVLRADAVRVTDARGGVLAERRGPLYVLAGQSVEWPLTTHAALAAGDSVRLQVEHAGTRGEHSLTVE